LNLYQTRFLLLNPSLQLYKSKQLRNEKEALNQKMNQGRNLILLKKERQPKQRKVNKRKMIILTSMKRARRRRLLLKRSQNLRELKGGKQLTTMK
jgi:hypothetical protein